MSDERDSADVSADKYTATRASRANKNRVIYNESEDLMKKQVPGGRKQVEGMKVPGLDAEDAGHRAMAQHSADYISEASNRSPNRAKLEASRAAFHAVKSSSKRGVPRDVEAPCTGSGCIKTAPSGSDTCGRGDCGKSLDKNVGRPKG
jgi:hypothetical protein